MSEQETAGVRVRITKIIDHHPVFDTDWKWIEYEVIKPDGSTETKVGRVARFVRDNSVPVELDLS